MKLDELARHASTDARVSVAHLEAPPIGERPPRRSLAPVVAGVAVTALVVGGLAVLARDRSGGDAPSSPDSILPTVVEVPRLGVLLDGWSVSFAGSLDDLTGGAPVPTFTYYGQSGSDDPFAERDLLVAAFAAADPTAPTEPAPGGETVELRGTTGSVSAGTDQGLPGDATSLTWREVHADGTATEVVLISRSADADELARIAEDLTVDPATSAVTPADDLGLERVAVAAGTPFDAMRGSGDGYLVAYERANPADFVVIATSRGDLTSETTAVRWWTTDVEDVVVEGRPGSLATFGDGLAEVGPLLTWSPADGVVATLSHFGADDTLDPVSIASTAFEIDDATWQTYLSAAEAAAAGADEFDEIFGQGEGAVGDAEYSWVLGLQGDSLCFNLRVGSDGSGSCQERSAVDVPAGSARTVDNSFGPVVADVVIAADPEVDEIRPMQGEYHIARVEADGLSWFVAIGDASVQPSFEVVVDGTVVATLDAGVEATAEIEPDLGTNPAAVELGVDGMAIALSGATDSGLVWSIGRQDADLCLVTDGVEPSAICVPADDVAVFPPAETPDGAFSFVVARDVPDCVDALTVDGPIVDVAGSGGDEQHDYRYWIAVGRSDGWTLELTAGGDRTSIELPVDLGSVPYPPDVCG